MYTCGPTVYFYPTIGNYRTFVFSDVVGRVLRFNGYKVRSIMNFTDVGHLTGDNSGDADSGEDRIEKAATKEGKTAQDITDFYINDFVTSFDKLNMLKPTKFTRATEYINEQIELIKTLEQKGYTYVISDGVYFDTSKFEEYGKLSGFTPETIMEGARVEPNPQKRNPMDFGLWKLSPSDEQRLQEWDSPWGKGFPGWHLECSAMALKELGETVDFHLGGEDLKMIHHQDEIAQSECATNKKFVRYWMHGAFMLVDGGKMSKSLGNGYVLSDIEAKGFDLLALRYFYMGANYRTQINFTWEALANAQNSLKKIYDILGAYKDEKNTLPDGEYVNIFRDKVNNDINMPEALAVFWEMLKSSIPESKKVATALEMDKVLGLRLEEQIGYVVPQEILDLAKTRNEYRKSGIWDKADMIRKELLVRGYIVEDIQSGGFKVRRKS
jgi:cysteinyl-tRNA synthetase